MPRFRLIVRSIVGVNFALALLALLPGCAATTLGLALAPAVDVAPTQNPSPEELPKPPAETPLLPAPVKPNEGQPDALPKPIDLPTALQLADARNPLVAFTRERVQQAYAQLERADVLWLPAVRAGAAFNHHDGSIQDISGRQIEISRNDFYSGLGASPYGIGSPIVPGIWANFQLADAIFQPLAAQQAVGARPRPCPYN
jgi:outer membrane protein TolC